MMPTGNGILQIVVYMVVLIALAKPLGAYMAAVYEGRSVVNRLFAPVERGFYRLIGTREDAEMNWKTYALAMLVFNAFGLLLVYLLQRIQASLPLNPAAFGRSVARSRRSTRRSASPATPTGRATAARRP